MHRKTLTVAAAAALLLLIAAVPALGSNGNASLEELAAAFDQFRTDHNALQLRVSILEEHIFEAMAIMGTPTATPTPDPQATPTPKAYGYRILESSLVRHDDIPLGLVVVETDGHYSQQLGKGVVESIVRLGLITAPGWADWGFLGTDVNAISFLFYGRGQESRIPYGSIEYAPQGKWSLAPVVETGDYRAHELNVRYWRYTDE